MQISLPASKAHDLVVMLDGLVERVAKTRSEETLLLAARRLAERIRNVRRFLPTYTQDGGLIHFDAAETALLAVLNALEGGEEITRHTALSVAQAVLDGLQPIAEPRRAPVRRDED